MSRPVAQCGTDSGYMKHRRAGEAACVPCTAAHAAYERERARVRRHYAAVRKLRSGRAA